MTLTGVAVCSILLFACERTTAREMRFLRHAERIVVRINPTHIDPANDGKLIHATGELQAAGPLIGFGMTAPEGTIVLERRNCISIYMKEFQSDDCDTQRVVAAGATFGAFRIRSEVLKELSAVEVFIPDPNDRIVSAPHVTFWSSYKIARSGLVTVMARQQGSEIVRFESEAGDRITMAMHGAVDPSTMFQAGADYKRRDAWVIGVFGAGAIFAFSAGLMWALETAVPIRIPKLWSALALCAILAPSLIAAAWLN